MVKNGQIWEFDYAKSDRQLFLSVFKVNNAIFDFDHQFFGLDPPSYWNFCMKFYHGPIYWLIMGPSWVKIDFKKVKIVLQITILGHFS